MSEEDPTDLQEEEFLSGGGDASSLAASATPTSGNVPVDRNGGLDITALLQAMHTGSQGRAMPSYATDAANVGSRVAKILERNLQELEKDRGFGRIGAALSQDIATGGRVPYAMGAEQLRGREVGQAVNIANASTGMARRMGAGGQTLQQLGTMLQRRTEQASREGNQKAGRINEMVRAASNGFDDPAMAQASIYAFMARKTKENPNIDVNELPQLMSEAIIDARRNGLNRKRTKGSGVGGDSAMSGGSGLSALPMTDGEVDFTKTFPKPKTAQEKIWNMSSEDERKEIFKSMKNKAMGKKDEGSGFSITNSDGTTVRWGAGDSLSKSAEDAKRKAANEGLATADRVHGIVSRIERELDATGATSIGVLGSVSTLTGGLKAQVGAALGSMSGSEAGTLKTWMNDPPQAFRAVFKGDPGRAAWLLGDNSEGAQRIRTNIILLAYAHSKAMDPGGRIAKDDVENTLRAIGETSGDPRALRVAMRELLSDMKTGIESSWLRKFNKRIEYAPGKPIEGEGAPAPAAAPSAQRDIDAAKNLLGLGN